MAKKDEIDEQISKSHDQGMALKQDIDAWGSDWQLKRAKHLEDIEAASKKLEELKVHF